MTCPAEIIASAWQKAPARKRVPENNGFENEDGIRLQIVSQAFQEALKKPPTRKRTQENGDFTNEDGKEYLSLLIGSTSPTQCTTQKNCVAAPLIVNALARLDSSQIVGNITVEYDMDLASDMEEG